jgi:hypothetical protein
MAEETTETQKPQITGSVRIGKDVYKAGMEEKLAKKATAKQLEHLASQRRPSKPLLRVDRNQKNRQRAKKNKSRH